MPVNPNIRKPQKAEKLSELRRIYFDIDKEAKAPLETAVHNAYNQKFKALTEERRAEILSGGLFALEKEIKESYRYSAPVEL